MSRHLSRAVCMSMKRPTLEQAILHEMCIHFPLGKPMNILSSGLEKTESGSHDTKLRKRNKKSHDTIDTGQPFFFVVA